MMNKILIIQDSPTINMVLKSRLESNDFYVDVSETGEEGVEKVRENNYDLILLDCNLPGISGIDVCRILKKEEKKKDVPVILLSAEDESKLAEIVKNEGAEGFISFTSLMDGKVLVDRINKFLKK